MAQCRGGWFLLREAQAWQAISAISPTDVHPRVESPLLPTQPETFDRGLDGDGRAEIACKTADATKDGSGKIIGDKDKDWRNMEASSRKYGRILSGPEFFTIFDGKSGAALKTVDYLPSRDPIDGWDGIGGNGGNDSHGNHCDRFLGHGMKTPALPVISASPRE